MSDDAHDDELGDLDDALFGDGDAKPAPPRDQAPKADIDWFAGIEETRAAGAAAAGGAAAGADVFDAAPPIVSAPDPEDFPDLVGDPEGSPDTEWVFQEEPVASAAPDTSNPDAEGPIVDAAIFGAAGDPPPQPLSRRELNARPRADRRRRVLTLVLVVALIALVQLKGRWQTILLVPTVYLAACVWEARLAVEPSVTRQILVGAILIVMMNARPQGLLGTRRVEVV